VSTKLGVTGNFVSSLYLLNNNNKYQQGSMNLGGVISITKSNKTNKNIFTEKKILIIIFPKLFKQQGKLN